uniref:Uncharacterized protein n=1 Tax=Salix viminalis TaxID=40686 RepID=A0A6N2KWK6_SALVM
MNKELELEKFITHEVPFSEINRAFEYMLSGASLRCIIRMDAWEWSVLSVRITPFNKFTVQYIYGCDPFKKIINNTIRAQFEEVANHGGASRTPLKPDEKWGLRERYPDFVGSASLGKLEFEVGRVGVVAEEW